MAALRPGASWSALRAPSPQGAASPPARRSQTPQLKHARGNVVPVDLGRRILRRDLLALGGGGVGEGGVGARMPREAVERVRSDESEGPRVKTYSCDSSQTRAGSAHTHTSQTGTPFTHTDPNKGALTKREQSWCEYEDFEQRC